MGEHWTIHSCYGYRGTETHVEAGDALVLVESGSPSLTVQHGRSGATVLDVHLGAIEPGRPDRQFPRGSARNRSVHPDSDLFKGHVMVLRGQHGCDVLQATFGFKGPGTGDDDDTEVVVATKPSTY